MSVCQNWALNIHIMCYDNYTKQLSHKLQVTKYTYMYIMFMYIALVLYRSVVSASSLDLSFQQKESK